MAYNLREKQVTTVRWPKPGGGRHIKKGLFADLMVAQFCIDVVGRQHLLL
jgi:hypothetical protein